MFCLTSRIALSHVTRRFVSCHATIHQTSFTFSINFNFDQRTVCISHVQNMQFHCRRPSKTQQHGEQATRNKTTNRPTQRVFLWILSHTSLASTHSKHAILPHTSFNIWVMRHVKKNNKCRIRGVPCVF